MNTNDVWFTVNELYKQVDVFFIGSVDNNGFPNQKVVFPAKRRETIEEIFFSTNTSSMRVKQYLENPKACVYFVNQQTFQAAMLTGKMSVMHDQSIKSQLWNLGDEQYYPQGETDSDYCILQFKSEKGRYYHNLHSIDFDVSNRR
jgi:general stress protein 26